MSELNHSREAAEVLSMFYGKEITVFVEGPDDVWFWSSLFEKYGNAKLHFEEVKGYQQLKKRMDEIINDEAVFIVAADGDYSAFTDSIIHHRIVRTYGYSIENTMYCPRTLNNVAQRMARSRDSFYDTMIDYIKDFNEKSRCLLIIDIANQVHQKGLSLECENSSRYLTNSQSVSLDENKINEQCDQHSTSFTKDEIDEITQKIDDDGRGVYVLIRGHFITNIATNWIKKEVYKSNHRHILISHDNLYSSCVTGCQSCQEECLQNQHYKNGISSALKSIRNLHEQ
jgi:hypothetical protein